ncbi:apolipoprotein A-IV-like isoform X2 [Scyliorhinus canicula]|uniref:apolipoprotein A-IV-like isoform X2 n=1 Tax=Scyliorhinus canicula TaxID=7830 RepID=UPI0018F291AE|nr:apolipoprotein A-IV-like isoform X2 [Scyliorhinus canicula]
MQYNNIPHVVLRGTMKGSWAAVNDKRLQGDPHNYYLRKTRKAKARAKQPIGNSLKDNLETGNGYSENLRQKLASLTDELRLKMKVDTENLQQRIRQELQVPRTKLSPFADGVNHSLSRNPKKCRQIPYSDAKVCHKTRNNAKEFRQSKTRQDKFKDNRKSQGRVLIPLTKVVYENLDKGSGGKRFDEKIQEILRKLHPDVETGSLRVTHQVGSIPSNYPNSHVIEAKIKENVRLLAPYTSGQTGILPENRKNQTVTDYISELKHNLALVDKALDQNPKSLKINKVVKQKLVNMKKRLSPYQESIRQEIQLHLANMSSYILQEMQNG